MPYLFQSIAYSLSFRFDYRTYFQSPNATDFMAFVSYLKTEAARISKQTSSYKQDFLMKHKLSLFEDSQSLNGRLQILAHIMKSKPNIKIDVLLVIRNRQCGILRWMVKQQLIDLYSDADRAQLSLDKFRFIKSSSSMTLGIFLCFAAVEYNDLFSLQWLCGKLGCPESRCHGLNILHLASLFGRLEIVGWLHTCQIWGNLVDESCAHNVLDGLYAAHVAAGQGHVQLAEMLLELGCKNLDCNKKRPENYAKIAPIVESIALPSDYKFAHEWARERTGEIRFDQEHTNDIMKLFELMKEAAPFDVLKNHIARTKILEAQRWINSGCETFDQRGPNSLSYSDIIEKCLTFEDTNFSDWVTLFLRFEVTGGYYDTYFWKEKNNLWMGVKRLVHRDDLLQYAKERGQREISDILSHNLIHDVNVLDPKEESIFSLPSVQSCKNLSDRLRSKLIEVRTLTAIVSSVKRHELVSAINLGNHDQLMELIRIYKFIRNILSKIGMLEPYMTGQYSCLRDIVENKNLIVMDTWMPGIEMDCLEDLQRRVLKFSSTSTFDLSRLYIYIVIEAQANIIHFCLNYIQGWTADIENDMVLSASFLGNTDVVNLLLHDNDHYSFCSEFHSRHYQAMLGACIAGRYCDLRRLADECNQRLDDPIRTFSESDFRSKIEDELSLSIISRSLLASSIYSFITEAHSNLQIISFIVHKWKFTNRNLIDSLEIAIVSIKWRLDGCQCVLRLFELYDFVYHKFTLRPVHHRLQLRGIAGMVLEIVGRCSKSDRLKLSPQRVYDWLESLIKYADIQDLSVNTHYFFDAQEGGDLLYKLKEKQRKYWAQFDAIKKGKSLFDVQQTVQSGHLSSTGYDRGGLQLIHLAGNYSIWLIFLHLARLNYSRPDISQLHMKDLI